MQVPKEHCVGLFVGLFFFFSFPKEEKRFAIRVLHILYT